MKRLFLGWLAVAVAVVATILVLNMPLLNSVVKNTAYWVLNPIQKNLWVAGGSVHSFFEPLLKANSLFAENEKLRQQVAGFLLQNVQIGELKKENDFLRQGLNLELEKDYDLKIANIVGKNTANDILIIDKGTKDMIVAGMPVITDQRVLVGKVSRVYDNFSEVMLATNKGFSFDVKIGDGEIDGLMKGGGNYHAKIDLVPKDKELKTGQAVVTSAMGGIFPEGFLVGTILDIYKNDVETFQSAQVLLAFDATAARYVFIAVGKYPLTK